MTEDELTQIESALEIRLPSAYRHTMLNCPFPLYSWPEQAEMPDNPAFILQLNREKREDQKFAAFWRPEYFAFGNDSGLVFMIDTTQCPSPVFRIDVESLDVTEDAATLAE